MRHHQSRTLFRFSRCLVAIFLALSILFLQSQSLFAATLTSASLALGDPRPSQGTVQYTYTASSVTTSSIKCIKMVFATTSTGTTVPTSMTTTGATFNASSNYVPSTAAWTVDASVNGTVKMTNASGATPAGASARTIILDSITNGNTADTTYFMQLTTFDNIDCATTPRDNSTVAFLFTNGQAVTVTIDPSLSFAIAGTASATGCNGATSNVTTTATTVPLGTPTTSVNRIGVQNLTVTTNAGSGYTVFTRYSGAPSNGSATITDWTGTNAAPTTFPAAGTEAYGYTSNDATLGTGTAARFTSSGPNWAKFTTGNLEVAYSNAAVSNQTTCVAQQVGIAGTTPSGSYTTSVIYTAVPIY